MRFRLPPRSLITNATSGAPDIIPASDWIPVTKENKFRGGAEVRCLSGTGTTVFLGIQTATDQRSPDAGYTALWASGVTTNTVKDPDGSAVTVSNFNGKLSWRWVWVIYVTSGSGWGSVSGWGEAFDQ